MTASCRSSILKLLASMIFIRKYKYSPKLTPLARDLLLANIRKVLDGPSNYEMRGDRVFIKSLNRFKGYEDIYVC